MLNIYTKAIKHFDKYVPCVDGHVLAHLNDRSVLVRFDSMQEAIELSERFCKAISIASYKSLGSPVDDIFKGYCFGDNRMLEEQPYCSSLVTA